MHWGKPNPKNIHLFTKGKRINPAKTSAPFSIAAKGSKGAGHTNGGGIYLRI